MRSYIFTLLILTVSLTSFIGGSDYRYRRSKRVANKVVHERPSKGFNALLEKPAHNQFPSPGESPVRTIPNDRLNFKFDLDDLLGDDFENSQKQFNKLLNGFFNGIVNRRFRPGRGGDDDSGIDELGMGTDGLMSRIFGRFKPWWKGENVCVRKEEYEDEGDKDDDDDLLSLDGFGSFSSTMTQCFTTDESHKCIMKVGKDGRVMVHETTYECCHGFDREAGQKGCTKVLDLKPLVETLRERNHTKFVKALEELGLTDELARGNYTLFVPNHDAMSKAADKEGISAVVTRTGDRLQFVREIVKNHIVKQWISTADMDDEQVVKTEDPGSSLRFNYFAFPGRFVTANCARLTKVNQKASNGIIHMVDRILMPAKESIAQIVTSDPEMSAFRDIVPANIMKELGEADKHYTIFVFTNKAFDSLQSSYKRKIKNNDTCMHDLIKEHIAPNTICSSAVQGKSATKNIAGHWLKMDRDEEDIISIDDGQIVANDRMATNGVIHMIDKVLLQPNMLDILGAAKKAHGEVFADLAETTGAATQISAAPEVTIFVPSNEILMKRAEELKGKANDLKKLVAGHVTEGKTILSASDEEKQLTSLAGNKLKINIQRIPDLFRGGSFRATIQCANIIKANVEACNGVLHYVDRVLSDPTETVMELLKADGNYSQFVLMIEASGVDTTISQKNFTGTVFVPTNKALEDSLGNEGVDHILSNDAKLKRFVRNHIIERTHCCNQLGGDFYFRNTIRTLDGTRLPTYNYGRAKVVANNAKITRCDQIATNGILHEINRPIMVREGRRSRLHRQFSLDLDDLLF